VESKRAGSAETAASSAERVAAVVLAAGSSSRLGSPKALLEFGASVALEILLATLGEVGLVRGVLVLGNDAERVRSRVDPAPLSVARNPDPARGRLGSLQCGLSAVPSDSDVLLWPVDRPFASAATVGALLDARARSRTEVGVIAPRAAGRRGHPVLLGAATLRAVEAAAPDANLREVLRDSGASRVDVDVEDDGIHLNLDTLDDYERARSWWERVRRTLRS
jgi:molybdenum cofactor cytidylyltransferase